MSNSTQGYAGVSPPAAYANDENAFVDRVRNMINKVCTMQLVKVMAVTNAGGVSIAGTVDVQILVNQIDGFGAPTPHGVIHGLPYNRLQGGTNAIILDPVVGDIGFINVSSHDIANVKTSKVVSNPGSRRRFNYADAVYTGGVLNGVPSQYLAFQGGGVVLTSPTQLTLSAGGHMIVISSAGVVIDGIPFATHYHPGVQTGTGNTGAAL